MKIENIFLALFLAAAFSGFAFAQTTGPLLQITNYSTVPSPVYAGTLGYLQITLKNSGDSTADSVQAYYDLEGSQTSLSIGDLGASSEVRFVVPFKAAPESAGGMQLVGVEIYYLYSQTSTGNSGTTTASSKKVSLRVPVPVLQSNPLEVNTLSLGSSSISPGEKITVQLELKNNGGVVNNLFITVPENSSFSLDGTTQKVVGTIEQNVSTRVSLTLVSSSSTPVGSYSVPLVFTYYDRLNSPSQESLSVGPVSITDTSSQYRLQFEPQATVEVGAQVPVHVSIYNSGTSPISAVIDLNSTDVFTPLGIQRVYFDSIQPGTTSSKDITLGVSSSASPGYYSIPLKITPSTGSASVEYVGLVVHSTPSIAVSGDTQAANQILIANTGNSQIHSVSATVKSASQANGPSVESFIGTLNVDDYATIDLSGSSLASGELEVDITFKDINNAPHDITQTVTLGGASSSFQSGGSFANRTGNAAGGGGLLGIFGVRGNGTRGGSSTSASGGFPLIPVAAVVIVIAIAGYYFIYHLPKKKKADAAKKAEEGARQIEAGAKNVIAGAESLVHTSKKSR